MLVKIVGTTSKVRVIRALFHLEHATGREISRKGKLPSSSAKAALDELVEIGLVRRTRERRHHVFALDPHHPFYRPLRMLFEAEDAVAGRVATTVQEVCAVPPFQGFRLVRIGVDGLRGTLSVQLQPKPGRLADSLRDHLVTALRAHHGLTVDLVLADGRFMGHEIVWPGAAGKVHGA